jgi:DNA-binding XRE family transcriptional regulator
MAKFDEPLLRVGARAIDESTFNRLFGRVLAKMRGTDDFNPTRTAQHAGIDRAFLYAVEKGEKGVSLFTLFRIASASKLSPSQIVQLLEQEIAADVEVRP